VGVKGFFLDFDIVESSSFGEQFQANKLKFLTLIAFPALFPDEKEQVYLRK